MVDHVIRTHSCVNITFQPSN